MMTIDNRTNEPIADEADALLSQIESARVLAGLMRPWDVSPEQLETLRSTLESVERCAALVAATRVPTQGEPNDNREALKTALYVGLGGLVGSYIPAYKAEQAVNEILSALSRATVPDAATAALERVRAVLSNDELVWSDGSYTNALVVEVKDVLAALDGAPKPEEKQ